MKYRNAIDSILIYVGLFALGFGLSKFFKTAPTKPDINTQPHVVYIKDHDNNKYYKVSIDRKVDVEEVSKEIAEPRIINRK